MKSNADTLQRFSICSEWTQLLRHHSRLLTCRSTGSHLVCPRPHVCGLSTAAIKLIKPSTDWTRQLIMAPWLRLLMTLRCFCFFQSTKLMRPQSYKKEKGPQWRAVCLMEHLLCYWDGGLIRSLCLSQWALKMSRGQANWASHLRFTPGQDSIKRPVSGNIGNVYNAYIM